MVLAQGVLDVLRVQVAAVDDHQVLAPAGDVELAVEQRAQVTGPQERSFAFGGVRAEGLGRGVGPAPVAPGDAGAAQPDLADAAVGHLGATVRVDDAHLEVPDQAVARQLAPRCRGRHPPQLAAFQQVGVNLGHDESPAGRARDEDRALGEAVAGAEDVVPQPRGGEAAGEAPGRGDLDGFGAAEHVAPPGQVERGELLVGDLLDAQGVGEVGGGGARHVEVVDHLQPQVGALHERHRGHEHRRGGQRQRRERLEDEPHVVVERGPAAQPHGGVGRDRTGEREDVVQQVAVRDLDSLGVAGGPGGVLEQRERRAVRRYGSLSFAPGEEVRRHGARPRPVVVLCPGAHPREVRRVGEHRADARVGGDGGEPAAVLPVVAGQRRHDRDHARVQAAEERRDALGALRVEQQHPVTALQGRRQLLGDQGGAAVQLGVGQGVRACLGGVVDEDDGVPLRVVARVLAQQGAERVGACDVLCHGVAH